MPDRLGAAALEEATKRGIRIALDDVRLNGANLAILSRCPLDAIKLDRTLVAQITPESPTPAWLVALSGLLQSTRVNVIGEGVETDIQLAALRASGVAMAQGYYFSRPLLADDLKDYYARMCGSVALASRR